MQAKVTTEATLKVTMERASFAIDGETGGIATEEEAHG